MNYSDELLVLDDQVDDLIQAIQDSNCMQRYLDAKQKLSCDQEAQQQIEAFNQAKAAFDRVAEYGEYAPDYKEKKKTVYCLKRQLDLMPVVSEFRACELELQTLLDEIATALAIAIDEEIKIEAGNPFFITKCGGHHCG